LAATTHTYLETHRLANRVIVIDTAAEAEDIDEKTAAAQRRRAAKTLVKEGHIRVTVIGLQRGVALGAHHVEGEVSIHVLRGALEVHAADSSFRLNRGNIAVLRAGVEHDARALRDSVVLLTASMR
jgi:quercetin dioxygenase-like cupin family protein